MSKASPSIRMGAAKRCAVTAIVAAAGQGTRLGLRTKKPFVSLAGKPLIAHTLKAISRSSVIDAIIVAAQPQMMGRLAGLVRRYSLNKVYAVVAGGKTRAESVRNCLAHLGDGCEVVVIHDGGRPFVDSRTIEDAVGEAISHGGCVVAVPEIDTVKLVDKDLFIRRTLDRSSIFRAQTPQVFRRKVIEKAYRLAFACGVPKITDDAGLVERSGTRVKILKGSHRNIKITTREDLRIAEALI